MVFSRFIYTLFNFEVFNDASLLFDQSDMIKSVALQEKLADRIKTLKEMPDDEVKAMAEEEMGAVRKRSVLKVMKKAQPCFRNAHDKVAFALHATFMAYGYALHATAATSPCLFEKRIHFPSFKEEVGIEGWNTEHNDRYAFMYSKPTDETGRKILVKYFVVDSRLQIDAEESIDNETAWFSMYVGNYVKEDINGGAGGGRGVEKEEPNTNKNSTSYYKSMYYNLEDLIMVVVRDIVGTLCGSAWNEYEYRQNSELPYERCIRRRRPRPAVIIEDYKRGTFDRPEYKKWKGRCWGYLDHNKFWRRRPDGGIETLPVWLRPRYGPRPTEKPAPPRKWTFLA